MSDEKNVLLEISDRVATITIDNAEKRNPLNVATVAELIEAFEKVQADDDVLAIVLTGAGAVSYTHLTLPTIYSV